MKAHFIAAVPVLMNTEQDVENYFDVLLGTRQRAIAQQAAKTATVVSTLVRALMADADKLSPASNEALVDAARVLGTIQTDLSALTRQQRPARNRS